MQLSLLRAAFPQRDPRSYASCERSDRGSGQYPVGGADVRRIQRPPGTYADRSRHIGCRPTSARRPGPASRGMRMSRKPVTEHPLARSKLRRAADEPRNSPLQMDVGPLRPISQDRPGRADWIAATEHYSQLGLTGTSGAPLKPTTCARYGSGWSGIGCAIAKSPQLPRHTPDEAGRPLPFPPLPSQAEPVAFEFRTLRRTPIRKQE